MLFCSGDDEHSAQILIILTNIFHVIKHMDGGGGWGVRARQGRGAGGGGG